jgi:phage terminase large subunit GpA-like protein
MTMSFKSIGDMILSVADILQPAEKLTVSQAAERYRYVNQPGAYVGPWVNKTTPMMVEPMDTFTSRDYTGLVLVGPAQSGKTDSLIVNTVAHAVKCRPMDMMLVCPTMTAGRDFSIRRIDRLHRHSEQIGEVLLKNADSDNKFDKHYKNGMLLTISWPTPTEFAGKPIGLILMTDYDRMPLDVGGDGNPYDLASKRTTTFGSYAMCLAESSPSKPVENLKWTRSSLHEAPPAEGILSLYNRGDRRRWYWPCPKCGGYFEGTFEMLTYERRNGKTNLEIADTVLMTCPACSHRIHPDDRDGMQQRGRWVKDGQGIDKDGQVFGPTPRTMIASFWLRGVAAVFTDWRKLVAMYLDAWDEFQRTGSEDALRKFYNNDLGEPYYPQSMKDIRLPETLKSRSERLRERFVPPGVRFLIGTADVQQNMWICQVFGILPGMPFDTVLIDRFEIKKSKRIDTSDDDGDALWVKPSSYLEDWDQLTELLLNKEYPVDDDSGRMMGIKLVGCDSGGKKGVTTMAYNYYRKLREENMHRRFYLVKGDGKPGQPRARITYPDASKRDGKSGARGDVPVLILNSNLLKDALNARLDVVEPGKGMYRIADWMPDKVYSELCSEIRTEKGWENPSQLRNEAWDLSYYALGICVSELLRVEHLNWANPPTWASDWDTNDLVRLPEEPPRLTNNIKSAYDFSNFGKALA